MKYIYKDLKRIKNKYSDKRKTKIKNHLFKKNKYNKFIHDVKIILIFYSNYIIKLLLHKFYNNKYFKNKKSKINYITIINNNKYILCFTKKGYFFWININNINYNKKYYLNKFIKFKKFNKIISIIKINNIKKYKYLLFLTKYGYLIKKNINFFLNFNKKYIKNIFINKKDYLIKCFLIKKKNKKKILYLINNSIYIKNIIIKNNKINKNFKFIKKFNKQIKNLIFLKKKYKYFLIIYLNGLIEINKINNNIFLNKIYNNIKKIIIIKNIYNKKKIIIINNYNKIFKFKIKNIKFNNNFKKKLKIKDKIFKIILY